MGNVGESMEDTGKNLYVCGPPPMMDAVAGFLSDLHVNEESIIKETV